MTYATLAHLQDRFGDRMLVQLTDRATPPTGAIDIDVVDRVLADTDAAIDGYLAVRYQLPLSSVPALVIDLALTISLYKLHRKTAADKVRKDFEDAMKTLRELSSGMVRLDVAGVEPATSGSDAVVTNNPERPITNETMKGFI